MLLPAAPASVGAPLEPVPAAPLAPLVLVCATLGPVAATPALDTPSVVLSVGGGSKLTEASGAQAARATPSASVVTTLNRYAECSFLDRTACSLFVHQRRPVALLRVSLPFPESATALSRAKQHDYRHFSRWHFGSYSLPEISERVTLG